MATLKMSGEDDNLRLYPQPVYAFRRQVYHCFQAGFNAVNDLFAWAVAPVSAGVKRIENRSHAFRIIKGAHQVVAIRVMQTYGLAPDDPATTPSDEFAFHICGTVTSPIAEDNRFGVVNSDIPAGRCAVLRHQGSHDALTGLAQALYRDWLPGSGEELRDFPLFFHYHNFVHEVAEHELLTDIYLPLK